MNIHAIVGQYPHQVLWRQMIIRGILILIFGLVLIRIFGIRAFGKQNALDIIISIVVGSNLSRAMTVNAAFVPTLAATAAIIIAYWLVEHAAARWRRFGYLVKGAAIRIAHDGRFDERRMRRLGVGRNDVEEAARTSGMHDLEWVDEAVLERNGKINTLPRRQ